MAARGDTQRAILLRVEEAVKRLDEKVNGIAGDLIKVDGEVRGHDRRLCELETARKETNGWRLSKERELGGSAVWNKVVWGLIFIALGAGMTILTTVATGALKLP